MRAFLAVKLSESVINDIKNLQDELKKYTIKGRWTNKDNLHITLKFFGEINVEEVNKIRQITNNISLSFKSFGIRLNKIGCFEGKDNIRVLWVNVVDDKNLMALHDALETELSKEDIEKMIKNLKPISLLQEILL